MKTGRVSKTRLVTILFNYKSIEWYIRSSPYNSLIVGDTLVSRLTWSRSVCAFREIRPGGTGSLAPLISALFIRRARRGVTTFHYLILNKHVLADLAPDYTVDAVRLSALLLSPHL